MLRMTADALTSNMPRSMYHPIQLCKESPDNHMVNTNPNKKGKSDLHSGQNEASTAMLRTRQTATTFTITRLPNSSFKTLAWLYQSSEICQRKRPPPPPPHTEAFIIEGKAHVVAKCTQGCFEDTKPLQTS